MRRKFLIFFSPNAFYRNNNHAQKWIIRAKKAVIELNRLNAINCLMLIGVYFDYADP